MTMPSGLLNSAGGSNSHGRRRRPLIAALVVGVVVAVSFNFLRGGTSYLGNPSSLSPTSLRRGLFDAKLSDAKLKDHEMMGPSGPGRRSARVTRIPMCQESGPTETLYDEPVSADGARSRMIIYAKGLDSYLQRDETRDDSWQLTSAVAERPLGHNVRQWEGTDADIIGKKYRGDIVTGKEVDGGNWIQLSGEPGYCLIKNGDKVFVEKVQARATEPQVPVGMESPDQLSSATSEEGFLAMNPQAKFPMLKLPGYTKYSGCQCTGSAPDLLSAFEGTIKQCMAKCDDLGGEGFVYVKNGDGGTAYFRGGFLSTPIPYSADERDTYKKDRITAIYEPDTISRYLIDKYADVEPSFIPRTPELRALDNLITRVHDEYIGGAQGALFEDSPPFGEHGSRWEALKEMRKQIKVVADLADDDGPFLTGPEIGQSDAALFPTMVLMKYILPKFHEPKAKFHVNDRIRRNRTLTRVWTRDGARKYTAMLKERIDMGSVCTEVQLQSISNILRKSIAEVLMELVTLGDMQKSMPYYATMQYTPSGGGARMPTLSATAMPTMSSGVPFESAAMGQMMMYEKEGTVVDVDANGDPKVRFDVRVWTEAGLRKYGGVVTGNAGVGTVVTETQLLQLAQTGRSSTDWGRAQGGSPPLFGTGGGLFGGPSANLRSGVIQQLGEETRRTAAFQSPQDAIMREMLAEGEVRLIIEPETVWVRGKDFEITGQVFEAGDRVKSLSTGKEGVVMDVDNFGDPRVRLDFEDDAFMVYGKDFEVIRGSSFSVNDRVMRRSTGTEGTVVDVDSFGDPIVRFDGEDEAVQAYGKDFEIIPDYGKSHAPFGQDRREPSGNRYRPGERSDYRQYYRQDYREDYPRVWAEAGVRKYSAIVSGFCDVGVVMSDLQLDELAKSGRKKTEDILREMLSLGEVNYRLREGYEWSEFETFGPKLMRWWRHMTSGEVPAAGRIQEEMESALAKWDQEGRWENILHAGRRDDAEPTLFDDVLYREIPSDVVFEDDRCIVVKESQPTAPIHLLVIPKRREGLATIRQATEDHEYILGHLMRVASEQGKAAVGAGGFRLIVNDNSDMSVNSESVKHLHVHVIGGRVLNWPPG